MSTPSIADLPLEIHYLFIKSVHSMRDMASLAGSMRTASNVWARYRTFLVHRFIRKTQIYSREAKQLAVYQVSLMAYHNPSGFKRYPRDSIMPVARQLVMNKRIVDAVSKFHVRWVTSHCGRENKHLWTEEFFEKTYHRILLLCVVKDIKEQIKQNFDFEDPIPRLFDFRFAKPEMALLSDIDLLTTSFLANAMYNIAILRPDWPVPKEAYYSREKTSRIDNGLQAIYLTPGTEILARVRAIQGATEDLYLQDDQMAPRTLCDTLQEYESRWESACADEIVEIPEADII